MAAITYTDGTIREYISGESKIVIWQSPSTADSDDTVVVPTITGKSVVVLNCIDSDTGTVAPCTVSSQTITLDVSGADTNSTYNLMYTYI